MIINHAAVDAAARYLAGPVLSKGTAPDAMDTYHARELVLKIAPHILEAERGRIRSAGGKVPADSLAELIDTMKTEGALGVAAS